MALWLVRAGRQGQLEHSFLDDERIYLNWGGINADLSQFKSREEVKDLLRARLPDAADGKIVNGAGQIWAFVSKMQTGDWVVLPSKMKPAIHVGEIVGGYKFEPSANRPGQFRKVQWIETDIPRSNFDQELLYSFGAFMTVCQISRNDVEARVRADDLIDELLRLYGELDEDIRAEIPLKRTWALTLTDSED